MAYINDLQYFLDSSSIGLLLELILVTTCISTIIFFHEKPIYFLFSIGTYILFYVTMVLSKYPFIIHHHSNDSTSLCYCMY